MEKPAPQKLLALWLALQNSQVRLTRAENQALEKITHQLKQHKESETAIEKELMAVIRRNANLSQAFEQEQNKISDTNLWIIDQLITHLQSEISLEEANKNQPPVEAEQNSNFSQKALDDEAFALACALVDELKLGWEEEWQTAAILDWEASGL